MPDESNVQFDEAEFEAQVQESLEQAQQETQNFNNGDYNFDYTYTTQADVNPLVGVIWFVVGLAVTVVMVVSMWKLFKKADRPGWASIIPVYNTYVMLKIAGMPGWWLLLFFIPFVNIIFGIMALVYFAKSFGRGTGFIIASIFFPYVTFPILAFGKDTYQGPAYHEKTTGNNTTAANRSGNTPDQDIDE